MEQPIKHIVALPFKSYMTHGYMAFRNLIKNHWEYAEFASIYKLNSKDGYVDPVKIKLIVSNGDIEPTLLKEVIINNSDYKVLSSLKNAKRYANEKNKAIADALYMESVYNSIECLGVFID